MIPPPQNLWGDRPSKGKKGGKKGFPKRGFRPKGGRRGPRHKCGQLGDWKSECPYRSKGGFAAGAYKAGKAGKAGKTKKSPALAQSTNTIAPTPCCSICAADFLPAPDSATMQDRENFMDPDPKVEFQNKCREFFAQTNSQSAQESVYFEFNDDSLTSGGREKLEFTAECLKKLDNISLVLEGHADDRGAPEYNLGLGDKRARNVLQYLTNLGVSANRLDWRSKGENEPLCMNPTEDCWAQNRRVELIAR